MESIVNSSYTGNAIDRGIQYLLSKNVGGHWKGFPTLAGESDIWVTGFVLAHISHICKERDLVEASQQFLLGGRHAGGGWSYSPQVPPDADSTAWCLMALQSGNQLSDADRSQAAGFLWSHYTDPGVSTYTVNSGIMAFIGAPDAATIAGWTSAHPDVSIAAALANPANEKATAIINWLCKLQTSTGLPDAYWWRSPLYTTTLLLRAMARLPSHLPPGQATQIAAAIGALRLPGGGFAIDGSANTNAFTTALALEAFTHLPFLKADEERSSTGNALLGLQQANGGWPGDYILRIPAPYITDPKQVTAWRIAPGGGNCFIEDKEGLFATALACYALSLWQQIAVEVTER